MKRLALVGLMLAVIGLAPMTGHANGTGSKTDAAVDTIDPVLAQNEQTRSFKQDIPSADIVRWDATFNGATDQIVYNVDVNGPIPKHNAIGPGQIQAPDGFVGISLRLMFTATDQEVLQSTGWACGSYTDEHTDAGHPTHQDEAYAECTQAQVGPFKRPAFKMFVDYGARININASGQPEAEGSVQWGLFDVVNQSLSFHEMDADDPCTTGAGFTMGGGVRENTTTPCPWGAKITSWGAGKDRLTLTMPYVPTWVLANDLDDNAVHNDELRSQRLVSDTSRIDGVIATSWVDQVVGLPQGVCEPQDPNCGSNADPTRCIDVQASDPNKKVDVPCTQAETNDTIADYQAYAGRPNDCTPNGKRGSCLQEIGGFVYTVDWSADNAYNMGLFGWPVPGYLPAPSCRYQIAVPFLTSGRSPSGVALYTDKERESGYTSVTTTYGLRIAPDDRYQDPSNPGAIPNGRKAGYQNVVVPGAVPPGTVPATTVDNPIPTTKVANPTINDASCTYTPFVGARYIDANGINGLTGA